MTNQPRSFSLFFFSLRFDRPWLDLPQISAKVASRFSLPVTRFCHRHLDNCNFDSISRSIRSFLLPKIERNPWQIALELHLWHLLCTLSLSFSSRFAHLLLRVRLDFFFRSFVFDSFLAFWFYTIHPRLHSISECLSRKTNANTCLFCHVLL